ncbi:unnamed protein product [Dimorphilus gyrociliatus]|uniref:Uncharacterized protein n=1 Tax=Dimorphilus gyrociliatus TaxID=2664684 RepID=A0A7I8V9E7_9ANNE|nr:unnamed protein product [Dimorphilus gyrociliatus]
MSGRKSPTPVNPTRTKRRVKFSKLPQRFRRPLSASSSADTIWKKENWKEDRWLTGSTNFEDVAELNVSDKNSIAKPCSCSSFMGCFCGARRYRKVGAYDSSPNSPLGGEEDFKNSNRSHDLIRIGVEIDSSSSESNDPIRDNETKVKNISE